MADSLSGERPPLAAPLRLVACAWLCVVAPLVFALEVQAALPRLASYGVLAWAFAAGRAAVVIVGFTAGRLLWNDDRAGLRLAAAWACLAAIATVLTSMTPYFPGNRPPSIERLVVGTSVALHLTAAVFFGLAARRRS